MSGKRARRQHPAESSSSSRDYDQSRFRSFENKKRFDEIEPRDFIKERGFDLRANQYPEIQNRIREWGWETVCRPATKFCPQVVKEFYANAFRVSNESARDRLSSYVREKTIYFTANNINNMLGLRYGPDSDSEYNEWMRHRHLRSNSIIDILCKEGARWELDAQGKESHFKKSDMKQIPKAWCTFVQSNILPTSNHSEVTIERAVVIYFIVTGNVFNVGSLISQNLNQLVQRQGKRLGYPCLITNLCQKDEVPMITDFFHDPEGPITAHMIDSMAPRDRAPADHPHAPILIPQAPSRPRAAPAPQEPHMAQHIIDIQNSLNELRTSHTSFVASHDAFVETQNEHNRGVAQALYAMSRHWGVSTEGWSLQDPSFDPTADRGVAGDKAMEDEEADESD